MDHVKKSMSSRSLIFFKTCSVKTSVLENFANLVCFTCFTCWSFLLIKLQALSPANLLVRDSNTGVFWETFRIFKSTYFEKQLWADASILKNFANFRVKHLRQSFFLTRLQAWRPVLLWKRNTLAQGFFCEIVKFLRTRLWWLLLNFFTEQHDSESKGLSTSWKLKTLC